MKKFYLFGVSFFLLIAVNSLQAQTEPNPLNASTKTDYNEGFQKGTSQIAVQGLSLGYAYDRFIGSIDLRYGYFIANNNLIFINAEYAYYGSSDINRIKFGLNYRKYFSSNLIKPFAQAGVHAGWDYFYSDKYSFIEAVIGGGAAIQIKKFGLEAGYQLIIGDDVYLTPLIGVSYKF